MSDSIRNKMLRFQAEPPASAWEDIAAALDETAQSFPNKLYNYQQQPDDAVWDKITRRLDEEGNNKVVPLKRYSNIIKYAAAAAVISIVALSVFYLLPSNHTKPKAQNTVADNNKIDQSTESHSIVVTQANALHNTDAKEDAISSTKNNNPQTFAATNNTATKRKGFKKVDIEFSIHSLSAKVPDVVPQIKNIVNEEVAGRYMIATNTQGDVVRLPKKAYSDFACADALAASANTPCKQKVENLQSKMAASMATDFAHFLDLLKNLQETR